MSYKYVVEVALREGTWTDLGPERTEFGSTQAVLQRRRQLPQPHARRRPVGVQHMVAGVQRDGLGVEPDGRVELSSLAGGVGQSHLLQKQRPASGGELGVTARVHLPQKRGGGSVPVTAGAAVRAHPPGSGPGGKYRGSQLELWLVEVSRCGRG